MNSIIDIIMAVIFTIVFLLFIIATRKTKTFKSYAVSDNSIGLFLIFFSFSATFIGPGFSMALVREGFNSGFFYLVIASFYGIAKITEGIFLAPKIRSKYSDALSIGDIIAGPKSHNNKVLQILVGIISFGLVIGFSAVLSKAGGEVINNLFNVSRTSGVIIMTIIVVIYSFFGGIKATILTDAFQFVLFTGLIGVLFITMFIHTPDIQGLFNNAVTNITETLQKQNISTFFGLIITWFFGEMLIPPTINRILAAKNSKSSSKALIYSGIFMIIWLFIMLFIGIMAKEIIPSSTNQDQLLLVLAKNQLTYGLFGVFAIAIVGIIMSTQDSLLNSASVIFTNDIFGLIRHQADKQKLMLARLATIIVGVISIILALYLPSILSGLLLVYSLWAPAILVPLLASLFFKRKNSHAAFASIIIGIATSLIWRNLAVSELIPTIVAGLITSFFAYIIVYFINFKKL